MAHTDIRKSFQGNARGLMGWGAVLVLTALLVVGVQLFAGTDTSRPDASAGMPTSLDADPNAAP